MAKLEKETFLSCSYEKRARGRRNRLCVRFKLALVTLVYCLERNPSMNLFVLHLLSLTHSLIKSVTQGALLHRINSPSSIWNFNYVFLRERISFIIPSVHSFFSFLCLCSLSLYLFVVPRWSMINDLISASRMLRRRIPQSGHLMTAKRFWLQTIPSKVIGCHGFSRMAKKKCCK